ncbi:MAG TPA: NAD(P)/FAD-dependent oxidoreductase [Thermoleophilia bacterium]|nr:NAD(P)/FAD-dependent oxidoreductase [Thermoleophilia bacterium]HQG02920.1 NAD(P)/FAD-dependent oxidoreductase [Thermoleophilia bacterium]HQG54434.1 NAD(P)/FAD-dependent oxidoreductase [Thermoleophilia bacterium]HQJ97278.1 NAD(P)/FAD-dependent oxidoreductase [Thermoleophilia bacterium]
MRSVDVAVVGAGPAGLCAAAEAARHGCEVALLDENAAAGGQLFKQIHKFFGSRAHGAGRRGIDIGAELLDEVADLGVHVCLEAPVWGLYEGKTLAVATSDRSWKLGFTAIVLATGATENGLAFPGWTLPGVMGAGCVQTMVNVHRVLPGERVLMVGSGNVGLIVAYQLLQAGAEVAAVVDVLPCVGGYPVHAAKVARAGVPILTGHTVKEVRGDGCVEEATVWALGGDGRGMPGSERAFAVDTVAIAVGLTPMTELAWLAGCAMLYVPELGGHVPLHDGRMATSVPGVFVAGDASGVEEASSAMEEGRLAGIWAAVAAGRAEEEAAAAAAEPHAAALEALRSGPYGARVQRGKEALTGGAAAAQAQILGGGGV